MTDPEDFLSRWSRRKRGARTDVKDESAAPDRPKDDQVAATPAAEQGASPPQQTRADAGDAKPDDVFDLSKLPSLDSIGPATDIRMFMQPGVPEALSRAALRRAWSADPGIRDFIGLAENSWDFTASDGMHGFGALDPADAKRLLAELFSERDSDDDKEGESKPPVALPEPAVSDAEATEDVAVERDSPVEDESLASEAVSVDESDTPEVEKADGVSAALPQESVVVALQQKLPEPASDNAIVPRNHGRALPQ